MLKREWKGAPTTSTDLCGAEVKIGMSEPVGIRCELPRNHSGSHRNAKLSWNEEGRPVIPRKKDDV
jgi:hypothetical protein